MGFLIWRNHLIYKQNLDNSPRTQLVIDAGMIEAAGSYIIGEVSKVEHILDLWLSKLSLLKVEVLSRPHLN